jgi:hypothetical protein
LNVYKIPVDGRSSKDYMLFVSGLSFAYSGNANLIVDPGEGLVTVDGTIGGYPLVGTVNPVTGLDSYITKLAFRNRFTADEKVSIELASIDISGGQAESREAAAMMRVWLADIDAAKYIDLNLAATRSGVQQLEQFGLIASGRSVTILDTPPTSDELHTG